MRKGFKKFIAVFLAVLMVCPVFGIGISAFAEDDILDYLEYRIYGSEVTLTGCDKSLTGDIVIPDTIEGYPVTKIDHTFTGCTLITSVVIPESVGYVSNYSFKDCTSLISINLPSRIEYFGNELFRGCTSLLNITADENNAKFASEDGILFSKDLAELVYYPLGRAAKTYTVPENVTSLADNVFQDNTVLENIILHDNVRSIGQYAFSGCISLKSVSIPYGIEVIDLNTFSGCTSLETVELPGSLKTVNTKAFSDCRSLKNITLPVGVTTLGDLIFYNCISLESMTMPNSITSVGTSTFVNCKNLKEVKLSDNMQNISARMFQECSDLSAVTVPDGIKSIGSQAFEKCTSLESINIPDSVTTIGSRAFYYCSSASSLNIGKGVRTIGDTAFQFCTQLDSVTIPSTVISIGYMAFGYKTGSAASDFVIYGAEGSEAEAYAADNGFIFIAITTEETENFSFTYEDGVLIVSGSGDISAYAELSDRPWNEYAETAKSIIISGNIGTVGENAFFGFKNVTALMLDGIAKIETNAFGDDASLRTVVCFDDIEIGQNALPDNAEITLFSPLTAAVKGDMSENITVAPFVVSDDTVSFKTAAAMTMYDLLDLAAILSFNIDNIMYMQFERFTALDFTFYIVDEEEDLAEVEGNTLNDAKFSIITVTDDDDLIQISFNELCDKVSEEDVVVFYFITESPDGDVAETPVEFGFIEFILYALKWIVNLLNKIFSIFSKVKK